MQMLTLPANLDALTRISSFITDAAEQAGLDERSTWQLQLAVDEAATNIIQHAYDIDEPGDLTLSWQADDTCFTVKLRDQGRGFDPQEVPEPDMLLPPEQRQIGGLGIYLMTRLMDEVHFDFDPQHGNLVTMVKYITPNVPDDTAVLRLSGRLDALAAPGIRAEAQALIEAGSRHLVIDLADVTFISSSGLRALLLVRKDVMTLGGELRLAAVRPHVREVFELTGFVQVFALHTTIDDAREAFGQSRA
jgi:serine/threonine-protein kinase RsbW